MSPCPGPSLLVSPPLPEPLCWLLPLHLHPLKSLPAPTSPPLSSARAPAACLPSPRGIYRHLKLTPKNSSSLPKPASPHLLFSRCHTSAWSSGEIGPCPHPTSCPLATGHAPLPRETFPKWRPYQSSLTSGTCCTSSLMDVPALAGATRLPPGGVRGVQEPQASKEPSPQLS